MVTWNTRFPYLVLNWRLRQLENQGHATSYYQPHLYHNSIVVVALRGLRVSLLSRPSDLMLVPHVGDVFFLSSILLFAYAEFCDSKLNRVFQRPLSPVKMRYTILGLTQGLPPAGWPNEPDA